MDLRSFGALAVGASLAATFLVLVAGVGRAQDASILLPNDWHVAPPASTVATVGNMPQGIAFSPDRRSLAFVESGVGQPALHIIDAATFADVARVPLAGASGRPLWDADSKGLWVGTGAKNGIVHIALTAAPVVGRTLSLPGKQFWANAIVRDPRSGRLAIAGLSDGSIALTDAAVQRVQRLVHAGLHPAALAWSRNGLRLYAALWGERSVAVIDPDRGVLVRKIAVGLHPEALVLANGDRTLYVANSDDDTLSTIDVTRGVVSSTERIGLFGTGLVGLSPTALALSGDQHRLYVVCAAANAIAVLDLTHGARTIGAIPTGWYPTDVALDAPRNHLIVIDGKGEGSHANPNYRPFEKAAPPKYDHIAVDTAGYIGYNLVGSIRAVALPSDAELSAMTARVRENGPPVQQRPDDASAPMLNVPPPAGADEAEGRDTILKGGPIHHVVFIIKENRTYDQVLGDLPQGDGDSALAVFGKDVTPNEHALAARFGLFDRTFTDSHVSQDGHVWLATGFANDYLERTWPPMYGGRFDEDDPVVSYRTHGGTLWDAAARANVSFRSYGENCDADPKHPGLYVAGDPGLVGHIDPHFPSFNVTIKDATRVAEWQREFLQFEAGGDLPSLEWMWLPSDHTAGTRSGMPTPRAMVAENDYAVGTVIATLSHSRFWADTAVFVIEDDAQNGPDHVDEQRTTLYVVSPYARAGTHHEHYTQNSVVRTIELMLGLPAMSTYDGGARPLYAAFQRTPDLRPYDALAPKVNVNELNARTAYRALDSDAMDFTGPDRAPAGVLNDIIEHSVALGRR